MGLILSKGKEYLKAVEESKEWFSLNHEEIFNDANGWESDERRLADLIVDLYRGDFYHLHDLAGFDYRRLVWALRLIELVGLGQIQFFRDYCRNDGRIVDWRSRRD